MKPLLLPVLAATLLSTAHADEQPPAALEKQVDALFAKWSSDSTPGAAVEVIRDGKVLLRKAYGMADIERKVPNTVATPFNVGSMSKQFTAFAIHLLAQEGKLDLDDDIAKHLAVAPAVGKTITIRQLMQHTSGLRDYINLIAMGGWRLNDTLTESDAGDVIARQTSLNFEPGAEHLYSNSGYYLLARIVERASGKPFAVFAKERIFEPLGMKNTFFQQDYAALVPGRALSYGPAAKGYELATVQFNSAGPGGLITTLDDLARWDQNFYDARVGGAELIRQMQVPGTLKNGKPLVYASGLFIERYRGDTLVEHSGGIGGFRSQMTRFPARHFTVAVLANAGDVSTVSMTRRIADIYLDAELAPKPTAPATTTGGRTEISVTPEQIKPLTGYFAMTPSFGLNFTLEDGQLMAQGTGQPKFPVYASGEREFFFKVVDARFAFDAPGADGVVAGGTLFQNGRAMPVRRAELPGYSAEALKSFEGSFYSEELRTVYTMKSDGKQLLLTYPRGTLPLSVVGSDGRFAAPFPLGDIAYQCDGAGACKSFTVSNARARNVVFRKVSL